ncbi:MAG: hypothetical protein J6S14_11915 [Clostridia bacterium]|nr:hypothetical protein [Clostridia bacterium]
MAIRTNSKIARKNIIDYIRKYNADDLEENGLENCSDAEMLQYIRDGFTRQACYENNLRRCGGNMFQVFKDWAQGLAMGNLFCYYYNRPAHDDLARLLDETPEQSAKYTEDQAADCLTRLIFREIWEA